LKSGDENLFLTGLKEPEAAKEQSWKNKGGEGFKLPEKV
jgi:hypothetical protein